MDIENIELPLRDICEELKELNKRMELLNETLLVNLHCSFSDMSVVSGRDSARAYLANRKQQ